MLKEITFSEDRAYRIGSESEPIQLYAQCIKNSKQIDLLIGYFNSAAINNLSLGFASFLKQGGTMRLIVNDVQPELKSLNESSKHFISCLAWMIENKRIQIKIIQPKKLSKNG